MRPIALVVLPVLAGVVLTAAATARSAVTAPQPASILVVADVGESAQRTMPGTVWRALVADYLGARRVLAEDGTALPDEVRCRTAHASYAVLATFDRAMRLPGIAQDTDRAYGIARFTVRNCVTDTVAPTRTVRIESEPLTEALRGEGDAAVAEAMWQRAVRASFAREPLVLAPTAAAPPAAVAHAGRIAQVASIANGVVFVDNVGGFTVNQILRDYADRNAHPHAPIQLVVVEITRRYVATSVIGDGTPRIGDYVDTTPVK